MAEPLHIAFTMDCERIASQSPPGGPETWRQSERAISGFCEFLLGEAMPPTLFLTPECALQHRDLFEELAMRGVELGLHIHPQSLGDLRYTKYLGDYNGPEQRQIIRQGIDVFVEAIGTRPMSFRSGNFSASDETFAVLHELGFQHGSVSNPGRNLSQYAAIWVGACPDVHWADATNRLQAGRLPFLEVPLTTDPARLRSNGTVHELRIESGPAESWHEPIIQQTLRCFGSSRAEFRFLCLFTHNLFDYSDPQTEQTITLRDLVQYLHGLRDRYDVTPATLSEIRERFVTTAEGPP